MKYVSDFKELENKKFETEVELRTAEAELEKKKAVELTKSVARKADATQVEQAFQLRNSSYTAYNFAEVDARKKYNEKIIEARKAYNKTVLDAKEDYHNTVKEAVKVLDEAEKSYSKAIKEFETKHPEGYHMTLHDGDNVTTISRYGNGFIDNSEDFKKFNALIDAMFNQFI